MKPVSASLQPPCRRDVSSGELQHALLSKTHEAGSLAIAKAQEALTRNHQDSFERATTQPHVIVALGVPVESDGSIGPSLKARIDKTEALARLHPTAHIVVTGGAVRNRFGEAQTMKEDLVSRGISSSRIVVEPLARITLDNATLSWIRLPSDSIAYSPRLIVVAEPYHAMRALRTFVWLNEMVPKFSTIKLAPAARVPLVSDAFKSEIERCIEEKRRVLFGW